MPEQYQLDFDDSTAFRDQLIMRAREEARFEIEHRSRYMTPDRFVPFDEKVAYMRDVLSEEYAPATVAGYHDKQVMAVYGKLQEKKIDELVKAQLSAIEVRAQEISDLTEQFHRGEMSLADALRTYAEGRNDENQ